MPVLVAITALLLLIFGINLIDQRIDPAAVAALDFPRRASVADGDNAYYALYGFRAAPDADPHAAGIAFVASANSRKHHVSGTEAARAPEELKFVGSTEKLCKQRKEDCLRQYRTKRRDIRQLAESNSVLLDRYRALYRYPVFQETLDKRLLGTALPSFPGDEHRLVLALIGLAALDGQVESALRALAADTVFWRRVLERADTLITKMIATSFLDQNFALLAEIAQRYQHRPAVLSSAKNMVAPMTAAERSCTDAFRAEYAWQAGLFDAWSEGRFDNIGLDEDPNPAGRMLIRLMLKPNATINLLLSRYQTTVRIAEAPAHELVEMSDMLSREEERAADIIRWDMVYNPIGKVMAAISAPSLHAYARYAARVHNLDGRIQLVALQLALYEDRVPDAQISKIISTRLRTHHDPYREAAMTWDSKRRALLFWGIGREGPGLKLNQEIAVKL